MATSGLLFAVHRGNSKYHYYGIRVKPESQLTHVPDDGSPVLSRSQSSKRTKAPQRSESSTNSEHASPPAAQVRIVKVSKALVYYSHCHLKKYSLLMFQQQQNNHQQYIGDSSQAIPDFPRIEFPSHSLLPEDCTLEDVDTFRSIYREHCEVSHWSLDLFIKIWIRIRVHFIINFLF